MHDNDDSEDDVANLFGEDDEALPAEKKLKENQEEEEEEEEVVVAPEPTLEEAGLMCQLQPNHPANCCAVMAANNALQASNPPHSHVASNPYPPPIRTHLSLCPASPPLGAGLLPGRLLHKGSRI